MRARPVPSVGGWGHAVPLISLRIVLCAERPERSMGRWAGALCFRIRGDAGGVDDYDDGGGGDGEGDGGGGGAGW